MKVVRALGIWLAVGGSFAAWLAFAGRWLPALDPLASFLPLWGAATLLGLLIAWRRPRWTIVVALFGLAPVAMAILPEWTRPVPVAGGSPANIRVLTHNVWQENDNPADTAQALIDARPDVLMLQEVNGNFRPMLSALAEYFPYATRCPPGCDLAIFARWPITGSDYFLKDADGTKFGPPMLWARIAPPGGKPFTAATLHYPWPTLPEQAVRRRQAARALARIDRDALILGGDMNLTPWAAAMRDQDRAFAPLTRKTRALASWPAVLPVLPIDHLYAGPDWALVSARALAATGSDHRPILITMVRR